VDDRQVSSKLVVNRVSAGTLIRNYWVIGNYWVVIGSCWVIIGNYWVIGCNFMGKVKMKARQLRAFTLL
jgi:hypothetical protein